MDLHKVSKQP